MYNCFKVFIVCVHNRYHRQKVVEWMQEATQELQFTATVLAEDSKNYHAWQHRYSDVTITTNDLYMMVFVI